MWSDNLLITLFIFFWLPFIFTFFTNGICNIIESWPQKAPTRIVEVPVYIEKDVIRYVEKEKNKESSKPKVDENIINESIEALTTLGYKKSEARRIVNKAVLDGDYKDSESLIKDIVAKVV